MTGRQFNRIGVPGVFGPDVTTGLPLNETTIANQVKKAGYATAIMGKWYVRAWMFTARFVVYVNHTRRVYSLID